MQSKDTKYGVKARVVDFHLVKKEEGRWEQLLENKNLGKAFVQVRWCRRCRVHRCVYPLPARDWTPQGSDHTRTHTHARTPRRVRTVGSRHMEPGRRLGTAICLSLIAAWWPKSALP